MIAAERQCASSTHVKFALHKWDFQLIAFAYGEDCFRHTFWCLAFTAVCDAEVDLPTSSLAVSETTMF